MQRLLILSCSKRKRLDSGTLPAIERYHGPAFQVVRRFLRQSSSEPLDIQILSASAGLIAATFPIPYYDQRMTLQRACALQNDVTTTFQTLIQTHPYEEICLCMGKDYMHAMDGVIPLIPETIPLTTINGAIGKMLSQLHGWLYGTSFPCPVSPTSSASITPVRFHGRELTLTAEEVREQARRALRAGQGQPTRYHTWYVEVDGQRVAPKWLISVVTGLPVRTFTSGEARRALEQLGVSVYRLSQEDQPE